MSWAACLHDLVSEHTHCCQVVTAAAAELTCTAKPGHSQQAPASNPQRVPHRCLKQCLICTGAEHTGDVLIVFALACSQGPWSVQQVSHTCGQAAHQVSTTVSQRSGNLLGLAEGYCNLGEHVQG